MNQITLNGKTARVCLFASDVLSKFGERFAFDYATLEYADRVPLDYNHDDGEIIGYCENFEATDAGVYCDAVLLPREDVPNARANEILYNLQSGVPYEASALVDCETAAVVEYGEGVEAEVNGRTIVGPVNIYKNAIIRGVAICPHGTDKETEFVFFKAHKKGPEPMAQKTKLAANTESKEEPDKKDLTTKADEKLLALIDEFGKERGVDYYLSGLTVEDARKEDYEQLKALRDELEGGAAPPPVDPATGDPVEEEEEDEFREEVKKELASVSRRLNALSAIVRRGDTTGVTETPVASDKGDPKSALHLAARKYAAAGSKKL